MPPAILPRVHAYWSAFFGLSTSEFLNTEPKVVPHAGLQGYSGAWLFRHGDSFLISVPPEYVEHVRASLNDDLTDEDFIGLFGGSAKKVIGPAYQGYLEPGEFRPSSIPARVLSADDSVALKTLEEACSPDDWSHGGMDTAPDPVFGTFQDGQLVAGANNEMWTPNIASPGIVTHPNFRGRGFGTAVLSAACEYGLGLGHLMLYQTLEENSGAVRAAEGIGYQKFATHLAVRL